MSTRKIHIRRIRGRKASISNRATGGTTASRLTPLDCGQLSNRICKLLVDVFQLNSRRFPFQHVVNDGKRGHARTETTQRPATVKISSVWKERERGVPCLRVPLAVHPCSLARTSRCVFACVTPHSNTTFLLLEGARETEKHLALVGLFHRSGSKICSLFPPQSTLLDTIRPSSNNDMTTS